MQFSLNKREKKLLIILIITLLLLIYFLVFRRPLRVKGKELNEEITILTEEISDLNLEIEENIADSSLLEINDEELHKIIDDNQSSFGDFYKIDSYIEEHYLIKLLEINMGAFSESNFLERKLDSVKRTYKLQCDFQELIELMDFIANSSEYIIGEYNFIKSDDNYVLDLEVYSYGLTEIIRTGITYVSTPRNSKSDISESSLEEKMNPKTENTEVDNKLNTANGNKNISKTTIESKNDVKDFLDKLELEEKIMDKTLNNISSGSKKQIVNLLGYPYFKDISEATLKKNLDRFVYNQDDVYISNESFKIDISNIGSKLLIDKYYGSLSITIKSMGSSDMYYIDYLESDKTKRRVKIICNGNDWQTYEFFIDSNYSKYPIEFLSIESSNSDSKISIKNFYGISCEN